MILSNKYLKLAFTFVLLLNLFACNIFKKNIKENENPNEKEITKIETEIKKNTLDFNTLSASFSGNYEEGKKKLPLKGLMKIKKDSFIWITLRPFFGIEVARILITTDSIKYIDKINNNYFKEDYRYIKNKLGFDINYSPIEALLTGKIFTFPQEEKLINYSLSKNENNYDLQKENTIKGYIFTHVLSVNSDFALTKNRLFSNDNTKSLNVNYESFSIINGKQFPNKISINTVNKNINGKAALEFKNIKINTEINAKFVIPKNYKRIKI